MHRLHKFNKTSQFKHAVCDDGDTAFQVYQHFTEIKKSCV